MKARCEHRILLERVCWERSCESVLGDKTRWHVLMMNRPMMDVTE